MALRDVRQLDLTEAEKRGVVGPIADTRSGGPVIITRHSRPVGHLAEIDEAAADLRDLELALTRLAADSGERTSFGDMLAAFGHTPESLAAAEDDSLGI